MNLLQGHYSVNDEITTTETATTVNPLSSPPLVSIKVTHEGRELLRQYARGKPTFLHEALALALKELNQYHITKETSNGSAEA